MAGLQINDFGRGLPDDFYEKLNEVHDEPPAGATVGALVKDYGKVGGWRLCRVNNLPTTSPPSDYRGLLFDAWRRTYNGTTADGANAGQRNLLVTVGATDVVAVNNFARGLVIVRSGNLKAHRYFITGNKAKDANNKVALTLHKDRPIRESMAATDVVTLQGHKYMNVQLGAADADIPAGGCLAETPVDEKFIWLQALGLGVGVASVAIGVSAQDGTQLIKAAGGELALAGAGGEPVVASLIREGADISADDVIPVEWQINYEM